jgi:hypothetical protein
MNTVAKSVPCAWTYGECSARFASKPAPTDPGNATGIPTPAETLRGVRHVRETHRIVQKIRETPRVLRHVRETRRGVRHVRETLQRVQDVRECHGSSDTSGRRYGASNTPVHTTDRPMGLGNALIACRCQICRSRLAGECCLDFTLMKTGRPPSRASSLPQSSTTSPISARTTVGVRSLPQYSGTAPMILQRTQPPVGVSLLTNAPDQFRSWRLSNAHQHALARCD